VPAARGTCARATIDTNDWVTETTGSQRIVIWNAWNQVMVNSSTTSVTSADSWHAWNGIIRSASTATSATWEYWASHPVRTTYVNPRLVITPEENARERVLRIKQKAVKRLARMKAEKLLTSHLSAEQCRDLRSFGFFKLYVNSPNGETRVYRIRRGQVQNVDLVRELPDGRMMPIKTLCAHPDEVIPDADVMLIQKLMLESCEDEFLRIANKMTPVPSALHAAGTVSQTEVRAREALHC
jgi:hypothetical protein